MKQLIQDFKTGKTILEEVPVPVVRRGTVLIKTINSLVSTGTEKMLVEFGKANLFQKAKQQPEKVQQVINKIKTDGLKPTVQSVLRKLNEPFPLGYCNAGIVIDIGEGVTEFKIGDRVASNGHHAEVICVPKNLVTKIPDEVSYQEASFAVIGAIALHSVRLANPTFGETFVVVGLGLVGQITTDILKANGCKVIAFDFDQSKVELAKQNNITAFTVDNNTDVVKIVTNYTKNIGADGVIITASTKSDEVISQAANMCRKKGRVILTGVVGLNLKRSDFYEKEISFQVSCSYGPGRHDTNYEQNGNDYPIFYVRWTEQRNFDSFLQAISQKIINVKRLISEEIDLEEFYKVYDHLESSRSIASILRYKEPLIEKNANTIKVNDFTLQPQVPNIGLVGAGNFTRSIVLPSLKKNKAVIKSISSSMGLNAKILAKKYNIAYSTTDNNIILTDEDINAIVVTTPHNTHAGIVIAGLKNNKHVFVEKPLALTNNEIDSIIQAKKVSEKTVFVGFNRRFSPYIQDAKKMLGEISSPINVTVTMNAGFLPTSHWTQDIKVGGGRIIGEACHLIDLITFLTGSLVDRVIMASNGTTSDVTTDNASMLLKYKNGSLGVVNYYSNGSKAYPKERVEIFSDNRNIIIDNFKKSTYYGFKKSGLSKGQDKGHDLQFKLFIENLVNGGEPYIKFDEIINTSRTAIAALESLKTGTWICIP